MWRSWCSLKQQQSAQFTESIVIFNLDFYPLQSLFFKIRLLSASSGSCWSISLFSINYYSYLCAYYSVLKTKASILIDSLYSTLFRHNMLKNAEWDVNLCYSSLNQNTWSMSPPLESDLRGNITYSLGYSWCWTSHQNVLD